MDETIRKAAKGDREALGELVREHYARVFRFCSYRLGDELGQDAAQETFVSMQRTLKRFQGRSSFSTWLLGIAHNQCRTLARKRRLDPCPLEAWHDPTVEAGEGVVDREALKQALAQLTQEHREVVLMHEVDGLRYAEIAELLGVPEGTVKSRLHHAFLNLRRTMAPLETAR